MGIDFTGERVVVTGAGGGVGRALVELFAELGACVIACDQRTDMLEDFEHHSTCAFDLTNPAEIQAAANSICHDGTPSVVVSNAGWTRAETLKELNDDALAKEIAINLEGVIVFSKALLPAMRTSKRGNFVFVSSVNALAHFGNPAYSVAKAGMLAWMRAIATEEGHLGIRANAVAPGSINTGAWRHRIEQNPAILDQIKKLYPLGRMVTAKEVARTVAFLASDWASGITGTTLPVDAGITNSNLSFLDQLR